MKNKIKIFQKADGRDIELSNSKKCLMWVEVVAHVILGNSGIGLVPFPKFQQQLPTSPKVINTL